MAQGGPVSVRHLSVIFRVLERYPGYFLAARNLLVLGIIRKYVNRIIGVS